MSENKKALSTGQVESAEECAGARIEGERNSNPSKIVYHENNRSSIPYEEYFPKYLGMGLRDVTCARCGKNFVPTRPEYAWGNCCSYHCFIHRNDERQNTRIKMYERNGRYLKTFETIEDAAKYCGLKDARSIRDFLRGRTKSAGGFLWAWDNDNTTVIGPVEEKEERNIRYENY
jgi:hypothetical protein